MSEKISKAFYAKLGRNRLSARTDPKFDKQIVNNISKMLKKTEKILDVGCGYGRILIPLAKKGFNICGVDLSHRLIREAKFHAKEHNLEIPIKRGNMVAWNYPMKTFDVIICLWSAFNEITTKKDQIKTLRSMRRVLKHGGWALLEMPTFNHFANRPTNEARIQKLVIDGAVMKGYMHDKTSLIHLMKIIKQKKYKIYQADWAGKMRQFLWFEKE